MDTADPTRGAISKQGAIIGSHEQTLQYLLAQVHTLTDEQVKMQSDIQSLQPSAESDSAAGSSAQPALTVPAPQPVADSEPQRAHLFRDAASPEPEAYAGDPGSCSGFLLQCELAFGRSPRSFVSDTVRVSYIIGKLHDRALNWAEAYLSAHPLPSCSYDAFLGEFKRTFAHPISVGSAVRRLLNLREGRRSIADYLIDFRTAAAAVGWPDKALQGVYLQSLNEDMKDQLASRDEPVTFEELASLTLCVDNRLRERERERNSITRRPVRRASPVFIPPSPLPVLPSATVAVERADSEPEPMQLGRSRLSPQERERRRRSRSCFYCGSAEHFISTCPEKGKGDARR